MTRDCYYYTGNMAVTVTSEKLLLLLYWQHGSNTVTHDRYYYTGNMAVTQSLVIATIILATWQ